MAAEWEHLGDIDLDALRIDFSAGGTVWERTAVLAGNVFTGSEWDEGSQTFAPEVSNGWTIFLDLDTLEATRGPDLPLPLGNFPGLNHGPTKWVWPLELVTIGDKVYLVGANQWVIIAWLDMTDTGAGWQYTHGDEDWWIKGEAGNALIPDNDIKVMTDGVRYIYLWAQSAEGTFTGRPGTTEQAYLWRFDTVTLDQEMLVSGIPTDLNMPPDLDGIADDEEWMAYFCSAVFMDGKVYALDAAWDFGGVASYIKLFHAIDVDTLEWTTGLPLPVFPGTGPYDDHSFLTSSHGALWENGHEWIIVTWDEVAPQFVFLPGNPNMSDAAYNRRTIAFNGATWREFEAILPPGEPAPPGTAYYGTWAPPYGAVTIIDQEQDRLLLIGGEGGHRQGIIEDSPDHFIVDPDNAEDTFGREIWALALEAPPAVAAGPDGDLELNAGTPAHVIVERHGGEAAYPEVSNWEANENLAGGWIGATGRVSEAEVREHPDVYADGNTWLSVIRESGDPIFQGRLKRPALNGGVCDLSADGPAIRLRREFDRLLFRKDGVESWQTINDEAHEVHNPPSDAPTLHEVLDGQASGLAGNNSGPYKYAMTFVTAELETGLGPVLEVDVPTAGAPHWVQLRNVPVGGRSVTSRKMYRKDPGTGEWRLLYTFTDNTTDRLQDNGPEGTLGALAPRQAQAEAIGVEIGEGVITFSVPADGYVFDDQRAGAVGNYINAHVRRFRIVIDKNRALPNWEMRIATADEPHGSWDTHETVSLDGEESQAIDVYPDDDDDDRVRLLFMRTSEGSDAEPVMVTVRRVRVYDLALDDDFTVSDMMRVVYRRAGLEPRVREHALVALPADFETGSYADVADWCTLLTGWPWLAEVRNRSAVGIFQPPSQRMFVLIDPEATRDLLPLQQANRVRLKYRRSAKSENWHEVTAVANPNPLENWITRTVRIDMPMGDDVARHLCKRLANEYAKDRRTGSLTFDRLQLNGEWVRGHEVRVGDQIYVPSEGIPVPMSALRRQDEVVTAELPEEIPLLERFQARDDLKRA